MGYRVMCYKPTTTPASVRARERRARGYAGDVERHKLSPRPTRQAGSTTHRHRTSVVTRAHLSCVVRARARARRAWAFGGGTHFRAIFSHFGSILSRDTVLSYKLQYTSIQVGETEVCMAKTLLTKCVPPRVLPRGNPADTRTRSVTTQLRHHPDHRTDHPPIPPCSDT